MTAAHPRVEHGVLLSDLLRAIPGARLPARREVSGVTHDSRAVAPGMVFVAIVGFTTDGHRFVEDARGRGAAAVVVERGRAERPAAWDDRTCAWLEADDTRVALSALAAAWHAHPARAMRVVGVTGTDGKTTTSYLTSVVLEAAGGITGLMSTAQFKIGTRWEDNPTRQTTLEATEVQALLARMRDAGVTDAVVESSSHGLALHKLDDCDFNAAVFTNVVEDHLDFHRTREAYWEAKSRLLALTEASGEPGPRFAVLNADDRAADFLRSRTRLVIISYGIELSADLRADIVEALPSGTRAQLRGRWGESDLWVPMPGAFNVSNALAAVCTGLGFGIELQAACRAVADFRGVPGRMVRVDRGQPFTVIVDYAHTGHAFRKLLDVLRPLTAERLIAVFGSAGEQSRERREGMGAVAAELADFTVITSEDPRFEDPDRITGDIAAVMTASGGNEGRDFIRVTDRRAAIHAAFERARPGDLVVLAGKGHEQSIIVGAEKLPWDERRVAEEELAGLATR